MVARHEITSNTTTRMRMFFQNGAPSPDKPSIVTFAVLFVVSNTMVSTCLLNSSETSVEGITGVVKCYVAVSQARAIFMRNGSWKGRRTPS